MIGYSEVDDLEDELYEAIAELYERADTIWALPEDLGKIEAWEEFVADCDQIGYPELAATGRFGQVQTYLDGGMASEALDAYARLMQLIHRHGDLIKPGKIAINLGAVDTVTSTCADDPSIDLDRITRLIDLVEQSARERGTDLSGVYLARAIAADAAGDESATYRWLDQMRAVGDDEYAATSVAIMPLELPLIARFDPQRATHELEQRLRSLGVDPHDVSAEHPDPESVMRLLTFLAFLYLRVGRRDEAHKLADRLAATFGVPALVRDTVLEYLIPVLEHRPDDALSAVDHALRNLNLDESDWLTLAAVARNRALAAPDSEEAQLLRALANQAAAAHDRRGGTTLAHGELVDFWWAGLPEAPIPAVVEDPAIWGDREERAETILSAGWLGRVGAISADDPPIAIKYRYQATLEKAMEIISAPSDEAADTLATEVFARAVRLRCATSRFAVPLLHGLRAAQLGDVVSLANDYERAQEELIEHADAIVGPLVGVAASTFSTVMQFLVESPQTDWPQIERILGNEATVRTATSGPLAHLLLAHAEVAAHLGRHDVVPRIIADLEKALEAESDDVDAPAIGLEVVRLTALHDPERSATLAEWIIQAGDAEQIRDATAWRAWFRGAAGDQSAAREMKELVDSCEGDVSEFSLPGWVILEAMAPLTEELPAVISSILAQHEDDVVTDELAAYACCASALLATAPADPRGPQLRERAVALAAALDERNGSDRWSTFIGARWFPGDPLFARG